MKANRAAYRIARFDLYICFRLGIYLKLPFEVVWLQNGRAIYRKRRWCATVKYQAQPNQANSTLSARNGIIHAVLNDVNKELTS